MVGAAQGFVAYNASGLERLQYGGPVKPLKLREEAVGRPEGHAQSLISDHFTSLLDHFKDF